MAKEEIEELFARFKDYMSGATFNAPIIINMNSGNAENVLHGDEVASKEMPQQEQVSMDVVCSALNRCKPFLWGNAAYAVAFCVCRDLFGWQDNASLFERQLQQQGIDLPIGTINTAMSRNAYMRLNVNRWGTSDVMERVLKLRDEFMNQVTLVGHGDG